MTRPLGRNPAGSLTFLSCASSAFVNTRNHSDSEFSSNNTAWQEWSHSVERLDSPIHTLSFFFSFFFFFFFVDTTDQHRQTSASTFTMGKSDDNQSKNKAHKATCSESKHKAFDGESKHKHKPSVNAADFEATDDEGIRHSQWRDQFRQLCEYKVQFGHCLVPSRYAANPKLGRWVWYQRGRYRLNTEEKSTYMSAEHIRALESIGFDWGTTRADLESSWSVRFQQLCEYKVQSGHCLVPQQYATNPALGKWVSVQRYRYKLYQEGKSTRMTEEHIRELESIGFDWGTTKTDVASIWIVRFQQLCEYKVLYGNCLVTKQYSANPTLGIWVSTQRSTYRFHQEGKPSPMTEERIRTLESIGFDWGATQADWASSWSVRFQQLCEFKVQSGHCLVPQPYSANLKLGKWVSAQRCRYKLYQEGKPSHITEEHIQDLESIGFDWGETETDWASIWSARFQQLCEYKVQFGHCLMPARYSANPTLRRWVSIQRTQYKLFQKGKPSPMAEERIRALESIGFDWGTTKTAWSSRWSVRFQQLCEYKVQSGHCLVPRRYAANPKLGRWVWYQRAQYKSLQEGKPSRMTEERIQELESVGFDWGGTKSD